MPYPLADPGGQPGHAPSPRKPRKGVSMSFARPKAPKKLLIFIFSKVNLVPSQKIVG